jgi:hypothetical protein
MISCAPRAAILWRPVLAAVDDGVRCHGMLPPNPQAKRRLPDLLPREH